MGLLEKGFAFLGGLKVAGFGYGTIDVCNKTGGPLAAGTLVYISGYDTTLKLPKVVKADADTSGKVAQFVVKVAIANNKAGIVYEKATLTGLNTNAGEIGDPVYLSASVGEWVLSAPSGADQIVQIIGWITAKSATVGKIMFLLNPRNVTVIGTSGIASDAITSAKIPASTVIREDLAADIAMKYTVYCAGALAIGDLLHISGYNAANDCFVVEKADGDNKPAQLIASAINAGATISEARAIMELTGLNTDAGVVGDPVYGDATTPGNWTLTPLTGADQLSQIVGRIKVKSATVGKIVFNLQTGFEGVKGTSYLQDLSVTNGKLAGSIGRAKLSGGFSKVTLANGTTSGANVTIAGMVVGDELVSVLSFTTAAAIATVVDRTSEYVVEAGVLTKAAGTDESNNQLLVVWNDLT